MSKTVRILILIALMTAAMLGYFVVILRYAFILVQSGKPTGIALAVAIAIFPLLGLWMIYATIKSGFDTQRLHVKAFEAGREVDVSSLPKRPSGRVELAAADELFGVVKQEWESDPDGWLTNYRLARAYDYAGDRGRARKIMKRAIALEKAARERVAG